MAQENENSYHGYRYLLDAHNSRQYAVRFDNGKIAPPLLVFAQDPREDGFKPNETIFAFDDEIERKDTPNGARLSTQIWQIHTDETGKPVGGKREPVEYDVRFRLDSGNLRVVYVMTKESQENLIESGFNDDIPAMFMEDLDPNDPGIGRNADGTPVIQRAVLSNLSFPPQQNGPAAIARMNIEMASEPARPAPQPAPKPQANTQAPATKPTTAPANNNAPGPVKRPTNDFPSTAPVRTLDKPKIPDAAIESVIKQYCDDLSEKAATGRLDPVVGRDTEVDQALKVLSRRKQASMCFTGDAGVGKTAMFSGVAQRIAEGEGVPEGLKGARILQLDLQAMNAGAKFRGQFEEKLKPLIDGLKEREGWFKGRKIIIAIDEIHSQLTSGKAEGGTDAGNMMKPFLTSQGISVMGTTTAEEYRKHIEKDGALASRFEQMVIGEPSAKDTKTILQRLWPLIRDHHGLAEDLADEDFEYIITMSNRYAPNESQPRKGEKVLDMAGASAQFRGSRVIEKEDVIAAVAQMSKLSVDFLNQNDHERFLKMEQDLPKEVLGQPGIQKVIDGLVGSRSGLNDPNQPWGCFVLQGPTGTGKTELCKALSRYLFGTEEAMIHLNMGEYAQEHSVARLIGAPPGYVGFDSAEPALTEKIRQRPYSILLMDEIEKAHPKVFDVLLPVLNDGKMEDNQGKTVLFNNVIVVMTTNLGAKDAMALVEGKAGMQFGTAAMTNNPEQMQAQLGKVYAKARGEFFRPEMINRIEELGGFVTFIPLMPEVISTLVDRELGKVSKRISDNAGAGLKNVTLEISDEIRAQLSKDGYNPSMGARPMRKVIREQIANPLGKWLMGHKEEVLAFAAKNGATKIVIDQLGAGFAPKIAAAVEAAPAAAVSNDNAGAKPKRKKPAGPKA